MRRGVWAVKLRNYNRVAEEGVPGNDAKWFSGDHDHLLVYARRKESWRPYRLPRNERQLGDHSNPDDDPRGPWNSAAYTSRKNSEERPNLYYAITNPNTREAIWPEKTRVWAYNQEAHMANERQGLVWWGKNGKGSKPRIKKFLAGGRDVVPRSVWGYEEAGHTQEAMLESLALFPGDPFSTPKPERLIQRVLLAATKAGDWVLDSFAGSGTTGAVAHKMGRRWIMVELGEHCHTHIIPRLNKVIEGTDDGGITQVVGWKGGGGFRYHRLAPSLLAKDEHGNWVVNKQYNPAMLAEAVCKLEGYRYAPSSEIYWQHGHSSEDSFIYVTTQTLLVEQLRRLNDEVGPRRGLLICCGAFTARNLSDFPRLTVKKIPKAVLHRCEWGHDDYSLEIRNLPPAAAPPTPQTPLNGSTGKDSRRRMVTLLSYGET